MSRITATVTTKGQITIPRSIRRALGIETGDKVDFVPEDGRVVMSRAAAKHNPFESYIGALPAFKSKRAINAWIGGLRNAPPRRK
jgi:AbrB family looped-hinge helix DNA binding protein